MDSSDVLSDDLGRSSKKANQKWKIFLAGAFAGLSVDTILFPIDTTKSRLQAKAGFFASGGFKNLYRGLGPVLAGSVPNAAIFFFTYESVKAKLGDGHASNSAKTPAYSHVVAASCGELLSSSVRVPCEVLKMRSQTFTTNSPTMTSSSPTATRAISFSLLRQILSQEGPAGLFRGFASTIARDVPFAMIQYPTWEALKGLYERKHGEPPNAHRSAALGSIAGALAALATTPLDVAKSRIMLAERADRFASGRVIEALRLVAGERGIRGLFAGVVPRVGWISAGAFVFLGAYEKANQLLET